MRWTLLWIKQNWVALSSVCVSIAALIVALAKYRRENLPLLYARVGDGLEIVNVGRVPAVNLKVFLIDKKKRQSARLYVDDMLKPDSTAQIIGTDCPNALEEEIASERCNGVEDILLKLRGKRSEIEPTVIAEYVVSRAKQYLVLTYRAPDSTRNIFRVFSPILQDNHVVRFDRVPLINNRASLFVLNFLYGKNQQYAPPFDFKALGLAREEERSASPNHNADKSN